MSLRTYSTFTWQGRRFPFIPARMYPGLTKGPWPLSVTVTGTAGDSIVAYMAGVPSTVVRIEGRVPLGTWQTISAGVGLPVVGAAGAVFDFEIRVIAPARADNVNYHAAARLRLVTRQPCGA